MGERRELGEVQSAPCADNSTALAAGKRQIKLCVKVGENADGLAASKANLMRNSSALLTLIGSIIHVNHEYWRISLTKHHHKVSVYSRFTRYLTEVLPCAHIRHTELSETLSKWNKRGIAAAEEEVKRRWEKIKRDVLHIMLCRTSKQLAWIERLIEQADRANKI